MRLILFISPHYNKCGESYIFKNFTEYLDKHAPKNDKLKFKIFNYFDEFNHIQKKYVIENPLKINFLFRKVEKKIPWLYYRLWIFLVFIHLNFILPILLKRLSNKYDEIHVVGRMSNIAIAFCSIWFIFSKKYKFHISIAGLVYKNFLRKIIWRLIINRYESVIIPSKDMYEHIFDYTKHPKISVIQNPVLTDNINYMTYSHKFIKKKINMIAMGRLNRQKGFDILIKSLKDLHFVHLDIYGEGEDHSILQKLIRDNNLITRVKLKGWYEGSNEIFTNYDLFVMPSRWEGPGHTVVEAMSTGIPVIVSNCNYGPIDSIGYGKFGNFFKSEDINDCKLSILEFIKNPNQYLKKAQLGAKHITSVWSCESIYKKYLNHFSL